LAGFLMLGGRRASGQESEDVQAAGQAKEPALTAPVDASSAPKEQPADAAEKKTDEAKADEPKAAPATPPALSKEMVALRDLARRSLARCFQLPIDTSVNTPLEVMEFCVPFGVDAQVRQGNQRINALGCLCWNLPCAGYRLLLADENAVVPRLGYGLQEYPGQFLAVLGQAAVPPNYEIRVGKRRAAVADLVEYEKRACRTGTDQAHRLLGLACYIQEDKPWKNELGDEWSLARLLTEELNRGVALDNRAVTQRLLGISYAMERRRQSKLSMDGAYARAQRFLDEFANYALSAENADGSWHSSFFAFRGASRDATGMLYSTGHILEWLAYWLPDEMLNDPRIVRSVGYVAAALDAQLTRRGLASSSPREIGAVTHAAAALMNYDRRVFRPYDPQKPAPEAEKKAGT
jgi:hypothetical protein